MKIEIARFYRRPDNGRKTKILRKVRFPLELDMTEFLSESLKTQTRAYREKFLDISNERKVRARVRMRAKAEKQSAINFDTGASIRGNRGTATTGGSQSPRQTDGTASDAMQELNSSLTSLETSSVAVGPVVSEEEKEQKIRERETKELEALVEPKLKEDVGATVSGLYELLAVITHKGTKASGGRYISWVAVDEDKEFNASDKVKITDAPNVQWYKVRSPRKQGVTACATARVLT